MQVPVDNAVAVAQSIIRDILASTQGRIFVDLNQEQNYDLYVAFEEPGDLVWVTLAMPALIPEKIT